MDSTGSRQAAGNQSAKPASEDAATRKALYIKAQEQPPIRVAAERAAVQATIAGLVVAVLAGVQHSLESRQVGFSWEQSAIAGVLVALPIVIARITEGFIDQRQATIEQRLLRAKD